MYESKSQPVLRPVLPRHPRWDEFTTRLLGREGCRFEGDKWRCFGDLRFARQILAAMGSSEAMVEVSIEYFKDHGGWCDCEVLLNVARVM